MDKYEAEKLITAAGGNAAFAQLLGLDGQPGIRQRVHNWKRRGIPPRVLLDNQLAIEALRKRSHAA